MQRNQITLYFVQFGQLAVGDYIVAGSDWGKIKVRSAACAFRMLSSLLTLASHRSVMTSVDVYAHNCCEQFRRTNGNSGE